MHLLYLPWCTAHFLSFVSSSVSAHTLCAGKPHTDRESRAISSPTLFKLPAAKGVARGARGVSCVCVCVCVCVQGE
jgi:hypothetical protein